MDIQNTSTQLLFTTLPIWVEREDGNNSVGTGFIFTIKDENDPNKTIPLIVTNEHVVANSTHLSTELLEATDDGQPNKNSKLRIKMELNSNITVDSENDLAVIPFAPILNEFNKTGKKVFYRSVVPENIPNEEQIKELGAIEEITFIGYPSGLYDMHNSMPIIRKGITATPIWNDFKGKKSLLIDAGVFKGSSGSPVFIYNQGSYPSKNNIVIGTRLYFIGVISETLISKEPDDVPVYIGLGVVVKSLALLELANRIKI